ncbi:hypothetical protein M9434_003584 [Picochlorum sp. BPE23]|nr:hypothetical protein M9434_003584 [Picochlorum sp. BPE23]
MCRTGTPVAALRDSRPRAMARMSPIRRALNQKPLQTVFLKGTQKPRTAIARNASGKPVCSAEGAFQNPFRYPRQMDGLQSVLSQVPTIGVYVVGAAAVAAFGLTGSVGAGTIAPESMKTLGKTVGGLVGAALGGYVAMQLKERRESAAIIELSNVLVEMNNPSLLTREMVAAVEAKYGIELCVSCLEEMKSLYGTFIEAVIPPGAANLSGNEHLLIQNFKQALGLTDEDAAPVHIDVGRRVLRGRLEAGSRGEDFEARKTFQKLIYVSSLVFGERKAAFLLPWTRVFGLTDAQVQVARRDNAKKLFENQLNTIGLKSDAALLRSLREYQAQVRLADEEAVEVIVGAEQKVLEGFLDTAIECIKRRTRGKDYGPAIAACKEAIEFNKNMESLKGAEEIPSGIGAVSLAGTPWEAQEGRSKDLREVFRVYLEERLSRDGVFSDTLASDAKDLRFLLGMGPKEAESIENDVKEKTYKNLLREAVTSGALDAAASKAEMLGELVEKVQWDGEAALALHESLYRQKLSSFLEKSHITDEEDAELTRLQKLLCVPNEVRNSIHKELCGEIFGKTVSNALAAGVDRFSFDDREDIKRSLQAVKLSREAAKEIVDDVARKYLLKYISTSRSQKDRISAAKEVKKMVFFSNLVLAPVVDDLKTEEERKKEAEAAAQQKEFEEIMAKAKAEAAKEESKEGEAKEEEPKGFFDSSPTMETKEDKEKEEESSAPKSLEKAESAAAARADGEKVDEAGTVMKSQKDITLAKDMDLQDRVDVYRNYLMYCMTGDVIQGPMGVQMVAERDESEFARLSQLGDLLGLTQMDVMKVHQDLAEQAFKGQVEQYMAGGVLTPEKAEALEQLREKMGLPKETADKVIKGFQNKKLISSMQAAKAQGNLTLDRILELKDAGVDPTSVVNSDMLQQLYRQEISSKLGDGTGSFDAEKLLNEVPKELGIDSEKAASVAKSLAADKRRTTLVQAVSFLRQKKTKDTVESLNNLMSCRLADPDSPPEKWNEAEEIADLYSLYCVKEKDETKRAGVQSALGLSDDEANNLKSMADSGEFKLGQDAEEEQAFF